jgi:hypothetical protein
MNSTQTTPIEPGNRITLPADWAETLGLRDRVVLAKTPDGILVQACPPATWQEIFASKLTIGSACADVTDAAAEEGTGDDFLF